MPSHAPALRQRDNPRYNRRVCFSLNGAPRKRARVALQPISRPIRTVLKWQVIATAILAAT
ncbi:MAG: hypothetical protein ABI920_13065, partial [Casimicrobiaceae bacterium]